MKLIKKTYAIVPLLQTNKINFLQIKPMKKIIFIISVLLTVLILSFSDSPNQNLTEKQAIKLAEEFIQNNGYTSLKPDKIKISYELFDENLDNILKQRYNTLQPKAFCISTSNDRYDIGFLSTSVNKNKLSPIKMKSNLSGRAVIVSLDGKEIRMEHKDPLFSFFTKL
jgi:hypothetical protein